MSYNHDTNPSAPVLLEVERFEHVSAGSERVLLRVDGRYGERPGKRVLDAMLFVDDGLVVRRHDPLPDPDDDPADGWLWRAAFEVPYSYLTDERTRFALESDPGSLIDLPRPAALGLAPALPLSARAAHLARRYAAAVAIVLAVAVAPGGLPAHARTDVLRVHHADGSVVYMTTDGQVLQALPADAAVIDQPAPAPAAPAPAPPAAPVPAPAAAPAMQDGQKAPGQTTSPPAAGQQPTDPKTSPDRGLTHLAQTAPAATGGAQVAMQHKPSGRRRRAPRPGGDHATGKGSQITPAAGAPATPSHDTTKVATPPPSNPGTAGPQHATPQVQDPSSGDQPQAAAASSAAAPLETRATLVTAGQPAALQPLSRIANGGGTHRASAPAPTRPSAPAPTRPSAPAPAANSLPTKGLQPLDVLGAPLAGGPAHGAANGAPQPGSAPVMTGVPALFTPTPAAPPPTTTPAPAPDHAPSTTHAAPQDHSGSRRHAPPAHPPAPPKPAPTGGQAPPTAQNPVGRTTTPATPATTPGNATPNSFSSLPGPVTGVPNFVIQKFHVPPFLLSIYQAAGIQYGIRWEVLAAINEIETDYGRNLNVSSAGALGWMQFMPATWQMYGVDANKDGKRDPFNPVDAIFSAARYLKAAGGDTDIRKGIFAYNHASWYVDSVMLRARLIAGYPTDLIGSLTGLTEGRFPIAAHARYADDLAAQAKKVAPGQNAANVVSSSATRRGIDIFANKGAPVVAVNDGVVKEIGRSKAKGLYVVLQDVYGNRYTYSGLGSLAQVYPVPKPQVDTNAGPGFQAVGANDPKPAAPASAGTQRPGAPAPKASKGAKQSTHAAPAGTSRIVAAVKQRLFAHPARPAVQPRGGIDQIAARDGGVHTGFATYDNYFAKALGLNSKNATLKRLQTGSQVIGSTVLGRVGSGDPKGKAAHIYFEVQPAGKGAPKIDPKPILDGWKLLESTAVYRATGRNVLYGNGNYSIGEIMLLPKPLLVKRVLSDTRIHIYPAGRNDIKTGQIDRRVLVVLEYLAESGLEPTVSCLKSGHNMLTTAGNVSEHSSGNAVDISAINGVPILGHQGAGDVTEQAVKRLMMLQGTLAPHQIISLLDYGANTMALPDHANHIHVGFHPLFGANTKLGLQTQSILKPGQWDTLVQRLGQIQNPIVPTQPSKYAISNPKGQR